MKQVKKVWTFVLAAAMVLALGVTAFAAETGSITITPPENTAADTTTEYQIYKVFDASGNGTNISYKLVSGKTAAPAGFTVDSAGNVSYSGTGTELTAADIAAIAAYVKNDAPIQTVTTTGTAPAVASGLANGYYYITTSTGSVVTIDSTNPNADVEDKNAVPLVDKKITDVSAGSADADGQKALAQVGAKVSYRSTVTQLEGAKNVKFYDTMGSGLKLDSDSLKVTVGGTEVAGTEWFTAVTTDSTIQITFTNASLAEGADIVITYDATVTSDALTKDPAKNTAYITYGDHDAKSESEHIPEVYNAKLTVTKQKEDGTPLEGAGFVVANGDGAYYKIADNVVSWVDSIDGATEYTSDAQGAVQAFSGLADGTYTLIEKTVPAGYNKAADTAFTIAQGEYTAANLEQTAAVTNKAGSALPSTGGIGTTIFYIIGSILVVGAGVVLATRRRLRR